MKEINEFLLKLAQVSPKNLIETIKKDEETKIAESLSNSLLNLDESNRVKRKLEYDLVFFRYIFYGFNEIYDSFKCLRDIEIYIGRFPYSDTNVSRARCLKYHIENYLNENYILENRLKTYIKRLSRHHKKSPFYNRIHKKEIDLIGYIVKAFKNIRTPRCLHVHELRFSDQELYRLDGWEFVRNFNEIININKLFELVADHNYKSIRGQWKKRIITNNNTIENFLDFFFKEISIFIFSENGSLITPQLKSK